MARLRILIVNDLLRGGGVEKLMQDLAWAWHDKYDITIRTDWYDEDYLDVLPPDVHYYSFYSRKIIRKETFLARKNNRIVNILYNRKLAKYESDDNFDIAISIKDGINVLYVSRMNITRKFAWIHTDYTGNYYTHDIFGSAEAELEAMKSFEKVVCVADRIRESIIEVIGEPGNLEVKYNPLDAGEIFDKSEEVIVDLEPAPADLTRFVTVGRINYQKGLDMLLEACHMLEVEGYKFEVIVVGAKEPWGAEYDSKLEAMQKRLKTTSVKFIGGRKNPYKYIKDADWFLSSSYYEGYSYVSQEAALLNKPMILTDVSGARELLGDSEYGIIVDVSVGGIYKGMKQVIENPELKNYYAMKISERKSIITYQERIDAIEDLFKA